MSDANPQLPSGPEPERLIAAVPPDSGGSERLWTPLESRLAAEHARAPREKAANQQDEPIRRRWWIEVLTGIAAFFLFALMLGDHSGRISVKHHTPAGMAKRTRRRNPIPRRCWNSSSPIP